MASKTKDLMKRIKYRLAKEEDYEGVLNINRNVYDGQDYIPAYYFDYLKDPARHLYVLELDGKIVGFSMYIVVDDGRAHIGAASRLAPEVQGHGLLLVFDDICIADVCRRLSKSHIIPLGTVVNKKIVERYANQPTPSRLTDTKLMMPFDITKEELKSAVSSPEFWRMYQQFDAEKARVLTSADAINILNNEINPSKFIPGGYWTVKTEPMGHYLTNYKMITKRSTVMITRKDGEINGVSFGTIFTCSKGMKYICDHYCALPENDPEVALAHGLRHLLLARQLSKEDMLLFSIRIDKGLDAGFIKSKFNELGIITRFSKLQDIYTMELPKFYVPASKI